MMMDAVVVSFFRFRNADSYTDHTGFINYTDHAGFINIRKGFVIFQKGFVIFQKEFLIFQKEFVNIRKDCNYVIIFSKRSIVKTCIPKRVSAYCVGRIKYTICPKNGSYECRLWRMSPLSVYVKDNIYLRAVGKRQQLLKRTSC